MRGPANLNGQKIKQMQMEIDIIGVMSLTKPLQTLFASVGAA